MVIIWTQSTSLGSLFPRNAPPETIVNWTGEFRQEVNESGAASCAIY